MQTKSAQLQNEVDRLYALQEMARRRRWLRGEENPLRVELINVIDNCAVNADDTAREQGWESLIDGDGRNQWNEVFLASIFTMDERVARILNKFGFRF